MKTIPLFLVSITLLHLSAKAQKSSWYAGGQLGYNTSQSKRIEPTSSSSNFKVYNWSFSPEIGTFLTDHLQLGLGLTYHGNTSKDLLIPANKSTSESMGGKAYLRRFWGKEAFKPFAGINIEYLHDKNKAQNGITTIGSSGNTIRANINAGFGYALSKRVTAIGSFGFLGFTSSTNQQQGSNEKYRHTSIGVDAGSLGDRFNVGFYYTFHQ
jgi:hypothetical protein